MFPENRLDKDSRIAKSQDLKIKTMYKLTRGIRWYTLDESPCNLAEAVHHSKDLSYWEVGVFICTPKEPTMYWTNRYPHVFHSNLVRGNRCVSV